MLSGESDENKEIVFLGRRTPLGTVGLGGFFAQPHAATSSAQSDENKPSGSAAHIAHLLEQPSGSSSNNPGGKQKNRQGKSVRLNINAR